MHERDVAYVVLWCDAMIVPRHAISCGGKGKIPKSVCPICGGSKLQKEEKALEAVVERGMPDGHEVTHARTTHQRQDEACHVYGMS